MPINNMYMYYQTVDHRIEQNVRKIKVMMSYLVK